MGQWVRALAVQAGRLELESTGITAVLPWAETGGFLEHIGCQPSSRFCEGPSLKGVLSRAPSVLLWQIHTPSYAHLHTGASTSHTHTLFTHTKMTVEVMWEEPTWGRFLPLNVCTLTYTPIRLLHMNTTYMYAPTCMHTYLGIISASKLVEVP